jgi:hypothetical protein
MKKSRIGGLFRAISRNNRRISLRFRLRGGGRGIRTPGTVSRTSVFKTDCFNRSHIPPRLILFYYSQPASGPPRIRRFRRSSSARADLTMLLSDASRRRLLPIRRDKLLFHKSFKRCRSGVFCRPRFKCFHVPRIQRTRHLEQQPNKIGRHAHLLQGRP